MGKEQTNLIENQRKHGKLIDKIRKLGIFLKMGQNIGYYLFNICTEIDHQPKINVIFFNVDNNTKEASKD